MCGRIGGNRFQKDAPILPERESARPRARFPNPSLDDSEPPKASPEGQPPPHPGPPQPLRTPSTCPSPADERRIIPPSSGFADSLGDPHGKTPAIIEQIVELYDAGEKPEQSETWRSKRK